MKHLKQWIDIFPRNQFLIVKSEELFEKTTETYNEVLEFLGLTYYELPGYKKFKERQYSEKLDTNLRTELTTFFQPHNQKLYKFLGKDFDWEND